MLGEVKHYKPGDEGFDEIAKQVLHVSRVRKTSQRNTYLDAEASTSKMAVKRRNEDVDKIRSR